MKFVFFKDRRLEKYTYEFRECRRYAKHIKARGASARNSKPHLKSQDFK